MSEKVDQYLKRYTGNTEAMYVHNGLAGGATVGSSLGPFGKCVFLRAGQFSSVTSTDIAGSTDLSSATTWAAHTTFIGRFTECKLTSNTYVMLYKWNC